MNYSQNLPFNWKKSTKLTEKQSVWLYLQIRVFFSKGDVTLMVGEWHYVLWV